MNIVRIICSYDALKVAQTLQRLLTALDYRVEIYYGRASTYLLEHARNKREAVLLIWSHEGLSASYMHDWAAAIDPARLVEVSRTKGTWPVEGRKAPVIDFTHWSGQRGGNAWHAMMARLRTVIRLCEPAKPPPVRAAFALGAASALVMGGALTVRINDALTPDAPSGTQLAEASAPIEIFGQGGAVNAVEPASDDFTIRFTPRRVAMIEAPADTSLVPMPAPAEFIELRDPTVLERLSSLTRPILRSVSSESGSANEGAR